MRANVGERGARKMQMFTWSNEIIQCYSERNVEKPHKHEEDKSLHF